MQIAAAAGMNCWSPGNAGNAHKSERSGPHRGKLMMLMWIILFSSLCLMVDGQMKISPETVQQWAVSFGKEITALSAKYSGAKLLQKGSSGFQMRMVVTLMPETEIGISTATSPRCGNCGGCQYSDYVRYVEPCFKGTLVQADLDNREHFKLLVEELHVKGEGKVKNAMKESFKILNEAAALGQGSLCNQAIMLITDGAMEDFQDVFEEFNWPERRVRVFTYLIGREMTFAENVKWIACNNKGYYTHISTLADVQENVMEYLHVLSRPMVINHDHDIIWTEAYMDSVLFNTQAQSLLLMTSVAMPVFSKKKETLSHGILLGVVGTDVALRELMRLAPRYKKKKNEWDISNEQRQNLQNIRTFSSCFPSCTGLTVGLLNHPRQQLMEENQRSGGAVGPGPDEPQGHGEEDVRNQTHESEASTADGRHDIDLRTAVCRLFQSKHRPDQT
ncbi:voltage-dependent calcium channel subunit alpha-2/delta-4-like isoform X1 [Lates japonicus]|uniref:Voltage-dependent calcium channel subunit alpha-2/delta-4-like isoform X1 n=1 Tax=Lates japonicus TaxID=270547 RepID=A0AAD3NHM5_LATJO|nr:voltage-dependent calcium channel subunit alpha-2/delta-4-like isoform X1 [Lates japonicus]